MASRAASGLSPPAIEGSRVGLGGVGCPHGGHPLKTETIQLPLGDDPPTARLLYGATVIEALQSLEAGSAHVSCTSPPYWGLRDYGVPPQDWPEMTYAPMPGLPEVTVPAQQVALGLSPIRSTTSDIWFSCSANSVGCFGTTECST